MKYIYKPKGVCCRQMEIELDGNIITDIRFIGGCNGNSKGVATLCIGSNIDDVVHKLSGITCGQRPTSCPDQLCQALIKFKQ